MARIFISYQRASSSPDALLIHEKLSKHFGKQNVFIDMMDLVPGVNFPEAIKTAIKKSDIFLVVIGSQWLNTKDAEGRTVADEDNWSRHELEMALSQNKRVVPVIMNSASFPIADELPFELRSLTEKQAVELRYTNFEADLGALISWMQYDSWLESKPDAQLHDESIVDLIRDNQHSTEAPVSDLPYRAIRSTPVSVPDTEFRVVFGLDENDRLTEFISGQYEADEQYVLDHATGFMWQKTGSNRELMLSEAQSFLSELNNGNFSGFDDWRIPTVNELLTLVLPTVQSNRLMISPLFGAEQVWCWSSDTGLIGDAWILGFNTGRVYWQYADSTAHVRMVRRF